VTRIPIRMLLVVEDNPGDARLLRDMIEQGEVPHSQMIQVESMAEAERHLAEHHVDVILLDLGLPDAQGLNAVERAHAAAPHVPLVILTGLDDENIATQALQIGAQDYLLKGQIDGRSLARGLRYAVERKALDAAVFTEKERAQVTLNSIGDAVASTDPAGNITYINLVASELTGWSFADAAGTPIATVLNLHHGTSREPIGFGPNGESGSGKIRLVPSGAVVVRPDGADTAIEGSLSPIQDRTGQPSGSVIVFRDVTDRRKAEAETRRSEERFRTLFDANSIGITISSPSGQMLEANDAYLSMLGYSRAELLAKATGWNALTPPEFHEGNRLAIEALATSGITQTWEMEILHETGRRVPVLVGAAMLEASEGTCIAYVIDLTARRLLEDRLRQAQKMEAVGQLAGGIAHDFNNLLTVILGHANMMVEDMPELDPLRESAEEIRDAGVRAAAMTNQLLAFSRRQVLAPAALDLNALVTNVERLLRRMIGEDVVLDTTLVPDLGWVLADSGQLEQVLMNLAVNARDAMPDGGSLRIGLGEATVDERTMADPAGLAPGRYVTMSVADTGTGMTAETQAHMFEPFYTTKGVEHGTGLGLATAYGIVKQSGGDIAVASTLGHGTTFTIYLPRLDHETAAARVAPAFPVRPRATETVLLVEDEASVRRLTRRILEEHGYRVIDASGGGEALGLARQHAGQIHLLLTDVVMPRMGGRELATLLLRDRPETCVVYMSGYPDDSVLQTELGGQVPFVQKPFTSDGLRTKLREAMARA
jgi:two-component system cell cycle sensor histidine kinase/response regulator CckA